MLLVSSIEPYESNWHSLRPQASFLIFLQPLINDITHGFLFTHDDVHLKTCFSPIPINPNLKATLKSPRYCHDTEHLIQGMQQQLWVGEQHQTPSRSNGTRLGNGKKTWDYVHIYIRIHTYTYLLGGLPFLSNI